MNSLFQYLKFATRFRVGVWLLVALTTQPINSIAANKALLIGTTEYEDKQYSLSGIDLDVAEMSRVARKLGFAEDNIRTLVGSDVTIENVRAQFSGFLNDGVTPKDTLLIYYSGHGVQLPDKNGDEADGEDEAITLHNLSAVFDSDNNVIWDGVLLDDTFAELLDSLVSENVIVIVDACHSGTVTRSYTGVTDSISKAYGVEKFEVKSLGPPRAPTRSLSSSAEIVDLSNKGIVTLSAAQDNQRALASSKGSLFTIAVAESLESQRSGATPKSLLEAAGKLLDERLDDDIVFHPNLTGDETMFSRTIVLTDARERGEVNQSDLLQLVRRVDTLPLGLSQTIFYDSDPISLTVNAPMEGYLNVIAVDSNDEMVVLFPNGIDTNNKVSGGEVKIPGQRQFSWAVQPPWGTTMITALFSEAPFNLFESSLQRDRNGVAAADYVLPSVSEFGRFSTLQGFKAGGASFLKTCGSSTDNCK